MTFQITTPDTASYVQDTVVVDKPHSFNGTVKKAGQFPAQVSPDEINPSVLQVNAKDLDVVGAVVNANDIGPKQMKQWRNANPVPEDLSAWTTTTWLNKAGDDYIPAAVIIEGYIDERGVVQGKEVYCKQKDGDPTKFVFADLVPGTFPQQFKNERETYTLTEKSTFTRKLNYKANWYYGQAIDLVLDGTPTKATFKLNVNTFKSQQGDIDAGGGDVPADVATKSWVNSQISDFVEEDALTAYYTKSETSSATELGTAFIGKVTNLSSVSGIMKISQADYDVLSAGGTADANTLYVIV